MEPSQKRKRTTVVKIEQEEDEDDFNVSSSDDDKDGDYAPPTKKPKPAPKPKAAPKPKPAPKPKKIPKVKIKKELGEKIKAVKKRISNIANKKNKVIKTEDLNIVNPIVINPQVKQETVNNDADSCGGSNNDADSYGGTNNDLPNNSQSSSKTMSDAEVQRLVTKAVAEARQTCEAWRDEEVVAEASGISLDVARNVINLLDHDCTIPFIVRYRKQMTGELQAEKLREVQESYEEVKLVHKKVDNILKTIKHEKFDVKVAAQFLSAKTLDEVELLYAPFKPGSKRTLAERSKQLGLEPLAMQLIEAKVPLHAMNVASYVKPTKGLQNEKEIMSGIQHIIADKISKDRKVLDHIREQSRHPKIRISSCKSQSSEKADRAAFVEGKNTQSFKYENYFELNILLCHVAAHQVMALNRGEKQKVLKVKLEIPFIVKKGITDFIWNALFRGHYYEKQTYDFLRTCVEDAYERLIEPHMSRHIRSELTKKAERESISVFGSNVRSLLLTPPVRGKIVLGIDPGFTHGCKIGVVSSKGEVLQTDVIYPHSKNKFQKFPEPNAEKILRLISTHKVDVLAIGNGTACRETEVWLSNLINIQFFHPFDIKYCIVNENGVSIYSVTKEAEAELPDMDPNLRSAVSIARRLQDPLLEYVKVEPKHLGVGMYQHDVPESQLKKTLDSIVEECVSFVGVDLNVCPELVLRKISGLSASRAKQIVEWRNKNGCFVNRTQLLEVKGLGQKSFEQCAGFVKILPETSQAAKTVVSGKSKKGVSKVSNPLDRTIIHPESYDVAERFLKELQADSSTVGQQVLIDKVNSYMQYKSIEGVASQFSVASAVMQLIVDALKQLQDYDIRKEFDQPLFRTAVRTFSDLKVNQELTGRVTNVTGFGAFVDVGVECNGLIHVSKMRGQRLNVGDRVTVNVLEVNSQKRRIGLQLKCQT